MTESIDLLEGRLAYLRNLALEYEERYDLTDSDDERLSCDRVLEVLDDQIDELIAMLDERYDRAEFAATFGLAWQRGSHVVN